MKRIKFFLANVEFLILVISLFAFSYFMSFDFVGAASGSKASSPSYCCEKVKGGGWCLNANKSQCDENYKSAPTSCESTSYCRLGTCYDSSEGICMANTPKRVCDKNGGQWDERDINEVPQCQLGCCIMGDQAAYVSLVRCKKLSSALGVKINYRTDVRSEQECISVAQSQDKGACVYEKDGETLCKFTTRADCGAGEGVGSVENESSGKKFYSGLLCSAPELKTSCAKEFSTRCYQGKVYWVDSCGNLENVYSEDKAKSWNNGRVLSPDKVCDGVGESTSCGNCDYFQGSRCSAYEGHFGGPKYGDYYCKATSCVVNGKKRKNGESWCVYDSKELVAKGLDSVGSRHFKQTCVDGKVVTEPCSDFRNEVCYEDSVKTKKGSFSYAGCRQNRWQDCVLQSNRYDCLNSARRDCIWLKKPFGMMKISRKSSEGGTNNAGFSNPTTSGGFSNPTGNVILTGNVAANSSGAGESYSGVDGVCVPRFPPGLKFWDRSAERTCSLGNVECKVVYERPKYRGGSYKITEGKECLSPEWPKIANRICNALGDCGGYVNYVGEYTDEGYVWDSAKKKKPTSLFNQKMNPDEVLEYIHWIGAQGSSGGGGSSNKFLWMAGVGAVQAASLIGVAAGQSLFVSAGESALDITGLIPLGHFTSFTASLNNFVFAPLFWASVAFTSAQIVGRLLGMSGWRLRAFSWGAASGTFAGTFSQAVGLGKVLGDAIGLAAGWTSFGIGMVIGITVYIALSRNVKVKTIRFECKPWQAPTGGDKCQVCNKGDLPCSEYRCKSLGQTCELVNKGEKNELCVDVNPHDVTPPTIRPNKEFLSRGYKYTDVKISPPGPGFRIKRVNGSNECIPAFGRVVFGINLNEPAVCKIDYNHTSTFDEMRRYMGGSNSYSYNHSEMLVFPQLKDLKNGTELPLKNGNEATFYIRCKDRSGNENNAEYAVRVCVDPTPDSTPPRLLMTSILNGSCLAENQSSARVDFYLDEPSECRWSLLDQRFDNMENKMSCSNSWEQMNGLTLYKCTADFTGVRKDGTLFYVRCKDNPGKPESERNENLQSIEFRLRGSNALRITKTEPNGTLVVGVPSYSGELRVETMGGCDNGKAICFYSESGKPDSYVRFYDTNNEDGIHTQKISFKAGENVFYVKCVDGGGNVAEDTIKFKLDVQTSPPLIARVYHEENMLKIITLRKSICVYGLKDCNYDFSEGTNIPYANSTLHVLDWDNTKTFYIRCKDLFGNEPAGCSLIARPTKHYE